MKHPERKSGAGKKERSVKSYDIQTENKQDNEVSGDEMKDKKA